MKLALISLLALSEAGKRDGVTSRLETLKEHWAENLAKAPHLTDDKKAKIEAKYNKFADKTRDRYLKLKNEKGCTFPDSYKDQAAIDRYNEENPCVGFRQLTNQLIRWSTTFNAKCKSTDGAWLDRYHGQVNNFFSLIKDRVRKYCPKDLS